MQSRLGSRISETQAKRQRPGQTGSQGRPGQAGSQGKPDSRPPGQRGGSQRQERQCGAAGQRAAYTEQSGRENRASERAYKSRTGSGVSPEIQERRRRGQAVRLERERRRKYRQRVKFIFSLAAAALMILVLTQGVGLLGKMLAPGRGKEKAPVSAASAHTEENKAGTADGSGNAVYAASENILDDKKILTDSFLEASLKEMAAEDAVLAKIYNSRAEYPEELLAALANNLELKDFVQGYLTADGSVAGGFGEEELEQDFPLFLQWDSRWGYAPYGESNIGISGCGPTCLSMVIFALNRDETATPDKLADYSMENNYYVPGIGTAWLLMSEAAADFGIKASEVGLDGEEMRRQLDLGRPIICAMRPGDFTTTGHFIVIYGYDENGFMVNDPNSRERSAKRWTFDELRYQIKNLWCYRK